MITQEILTYPVIPAEFLHPNSIEEFLDMFEGVLDLNIESGMELDFVIEGRKNSSKISPVLKLAQSSDAKEIADICKRVYAGTYPYREMEDDKIIKKMIKSPEHHFILFMVGEYVAGCFRCAIDFDHKKAYMGGFMLRKQFQNSLDVVKTIMGSYYWMWSTFKDDIVMWHCENRTAHAASQYITYVCGINTVAIFPNKDIFYGDIESDVMGVIYRKNALTKFRASKVPSLIENALDSYLHADNLYQLGFFHLVSPQLNLDYQKIEKLRNLLVKQVSKDKYGYERHCLKFKGMDSYLTFLHTISISNYEKAKYKVKNLEELYVLLEEVKKSIQLQGIRYCEFFVSAYEPKYQQLFFDFGFQARGYAPCFKYNSATDSFEDNVVFNLYHGSIEHIDLLPQGQELFQMLNLESSEI
jgi:hypothetical protein